MGKNKLKKFADMKQYDCVFEYPRHLIPESGFPMQGSWNRDFFHRDAPIVLELGCGKGEYTVGLAESDPTRNYIGLDIKGARMWSGATQVEERSIPNAAFLRTSIELIDRFFAPGEVSELWITFPDPQMKKTRKRLTTTRFLENYRRIMGPDGIVNLKTDSPFLYEYTRRLAELNSLEILRQTDDLYGSGQADPESSIKTYYEQQWLARGKKIKLISFRLGEEVLREPEEEDIERDDYRAYPRGLVDERLRGARIEHTSLPDVE
ncbi:MAG: tRNA (guanosine(46)-N7)-methyltransferase TrmB [Bacteroides sp.]|nr:tRNA (guanosine(46)-N7)-methyltransferase TrmB [Bacteroides sp.]